MIKQKSVEDEVQEKIEKEKLKKAKSVLTETQKRRIELYIEEGMSLGKIAQIEGVGKSKIDKSISQGIKKIKKFLNFGLQNQYKLSKQVERLKKLFSCVFLELKMYFEN